jgi:hypothetical protein
VALPGGWTIQYDGYQISGNVREGIHVTIPFQMPWSIAFSFIGQLIPPVTATTPGSIVWNPPFGITYQFGTRIVPVYAVSYTCKPLGWNGSPATESGLAAGDFFSLARITVEFESSRMIQGFNDDPSGLNQLDPSNPITACEQSIQMIGKFETVDGGSYSYTSGAFSGQPVNIPMTLNRPEVRLLCKFPRIPLLAWQLLQPYIGKVNATAILGCVKGSLLLEGTPTVLTGGMDGSISQNLGLAFAFNPDPTGNSLTGMDWNSQPFPDGSGYSVVSGGGSLFPYQYVEFSEIFQTINF